MDPTDPIYGLVRSLITRPDDAAVKGPNLPAQPSVGPQPQQARVAPETYHGLAGVLASLGNQVANGIATRRQTGLTTGDKVSLATMAVPGVAALSPEIAALVRGASEAAPAADAELTARNFYSTLPGLVQSGGAMSPATHARAVESLMAALPKAAQAAAPVSGDALAAASAPEMSWTSLIHPSPADPYAGLRPAAESMSIPAHINVAGTGSDADLADRFRAVLSATADAGKYKPDAAARGAAEMQRRAYSLLQP